MPSSTYHISLLTVCSVLGVSLLLFFFSARKLFRKKISNGPNWSIPTLDIYATTTSFFHRWDPRIKIASLFLYCFCIVSLQKLSFSLLALLIAVIAMTASHIPWQRAVKRLTAMAGFLSMFLIVIPFSAASTPGETLIIIDPLVHFPFHVHGFFLALNIVIKACAIALMMEPLLGSSPLPVTLQALADLGIPNPICQMILLAHRYIFVFLHEIKRMYRGMRVRGFRQRTSLDTMQTMGNFLGMLFVRSFDRTQRVYDAMQSRGYTGAFPTFVTFKTTGADWLKGTLWLAAGIMLLFFDRQFF